MFFSWSPIKNAAKNIFLIIYVKIRTNVLAKNACGYGPGALLYLLYEYRDLFIDMDVRNNRSELAIANRHQEKSSFTAFDWTNDVFSLVKIYRSAF